LADSFLSQERRSQAMSALPALTQSWACSSRLLARDPGRSAIEEPKAGDELIEQLGDTAGFHQNFHETSRIVALLLAGVRPNYTLYVCAGRHFDLASVWNGMRPNHRRDIQRATRLGIRIIDSLDMAKFLELNRKTFTRQGRSRWRAMN